MLTSSEGNQLHTTLNSALSITPLDKTPQTTEKPLTLPSHSLLAGIPKTSGLFNNPGNELESPEAGIVPEFDWGEATGGDMVESPLSESVEQMFNFANTDFSDLSEFLQLDPESLTAMLDEPTSSDLPPLVDGGQETEAPPASPEAGSSRKRSRDDSLDADVVAVASDHGEYTCKRQRLLDSSGDFSDVSLVLSYPEAAVSPTTDGNVPVDVESLVGEVSVGGEYVVGDKQVVRRVKNNAASKVSRAKRRTKFSDMEERADVLEVENRRLEERLKGMEELAQEMKELLVKHMAAK